MLNYQIHLQLGQELIKLKIIHLTHTWYNRISNTVFALLFACHLQLIKFIQQLIMLKPILEFWSSQRKQITRKHVGTEENLRYVQCYFWLKLISIG